MPVTREQSERFVQERITFKTSHLEQSRSTATRGRSGSRNRTAYELLFCSVIGGCNIATCFAP